MIVKIILLLALLQLLRITGKPIVCSGIYAGLILIMGFFMGMPLSDVLLSTSIGLVLSTIYFYLLHMFSESGFYWLILIGGLIVGLV